MTKLIKAGIAYAKIGWWVIPLHTIKNGKCTCSKGEGCDCPGKHPRIKDWPNEATTDIDKVTKWFTKWPDSNIGIATGSRSGFIVLDIDPRHGGEENLHDLQAEYGQLPDTVEALTGGGGRHLLFKHPGGTVQNRVGSDEGLVPGVDVRADGGLIVVSPSMHISGNRYEWEASSRPDETELAELPNSWLMFIKGKNPNKPAERRSQRVDKVIPEGKRNDVLFKIASSFRAKGLNDDEIYAAVWQVNINRCIPPLREDEIKTLVASVSRYKVGSIQITDFKKSYKCTDAGNSERFADMLRGQYLYVSEQKNWYHYNGKVWEEDYKNHIVQDIINCLRIAQKEAFSIGDEDKRTKTLKWLLASESQAKISAALNLMSSVPFMCARVSQFDNEDMLLSVQNGIVNLKTGELKAHDRSNYITKICNAEYNPDAQSQLFENFLDEITEGNGDKKRYLQKLCGYCLTGKITEEEFYQAKGSGMNGKTKLFETVKYCLGSYAVTASPDILMQKDLSGIPNDIARLQSSRLVLMSEPDPGKRFSDNAIKSLTGGDTIIARYLHKEFFEFKMKAKMVMLTNHEIKAIGTDHGLWRRMVVIPFTYQVPEEKKDKNLQEKLIADAEAVLAWMVQGCLVWQQEGLQQPQELVQLKDEYRKGQDAVGLFIDECCTENQKTKVKASELYNSYKRWCESSGEYELSHREFSKRLREKGYSGVKSGVYYWFGIDLLDLVDLVDKKQINTKYKNSYKDLPEISPVSPESPEKKKEWWEETEEGENK